MIILDQDNLALYVRNSLRNKLAFITAGNVCDATVAGGGLVSTVYKARVDGQNLYFKQAIPGRLDKVKELVGDVVPDDAFVVWHDERQAAEVKALQIFERAVPENFVPKVLHHDADNNIMVLSEVCGEKGVVLADRMNTEININHAKILGSRIAQVGNFTYRKFEALRDSELENKIKTIKYRYEVSEVWDKITETDKKNRIAREVSDFIAISAKIDSVLVHGDYHERNIMICGDTCGTYDLEESHWGDPIEDIGKLAASYVLRIIYFPSLKKIAYDAALGLLTSFFETLQIPDSSEELEKRLRIMIAGCLLLRIDGISSLWLPWVHDEAKKARTRQLAAALVLEDSQSSIEAILKKHNHLLC
jgi:5-methylthioribose kinase